MKPITFILSNCGLGEPDGRTSLGPRKTYQLCIEPFLTANHHVEVIEIDSDNKEPIIGPFQINDKRYKSVYEFWVKQKAAVQDVYKRGRLPIVLGGDHSIAIGTWGGLPIERLIWCDAHMDANTFKTSPSKAPHGMPLAVLMGNGEAEWIKLVDRYLRSNEIALIGARSFEEGEADFLHQSHVLIYDDQKTFGEYFLQASQKLEIDRHLFGITFDIDVMNPLLVPGTGTWAKGGFCIDDVCTSLKNVLSHPNLVAFECVEINFEKDIENRAQKFLTQLFQSLLNES